MLYIYALQTMLYIYALQTMLYIYALQTVATRVKLKLEWTISQYITCIITIL